MLENLAKSLDTVAKTFLQKQQGIGIHRFDCLFICPSIVAFAKTLTPDREFTNQKYVPGQWQMVGSTNQLFNPRNKWSKDLSRLAMTLTLAHQHLWASTSYDFFYNESKRFVQSECNKYGMGTLQTASCNKYTGVFSNKAKVWQEDRQRQKRRSSCWKQDRDKTTKQGQSEKNEKTIKNVKQFRLKVR